jgi:hypothetical protein
MPPGWGVLGFALGGMVMGGAAGVIWYAPPHRVAHDWLTDAAAFHYKKFRGKTLMLPHDTDDDPTLARSPTSIGSSTAGTRSNGLTVASRGARPPREHGAGR